MVRDIKKGELTEEVLREYFLSLGYFAVRSVPYVYNEFMITDVDLWLYARLSHLTRERSNVDIKRKKTPQTLERIFWAKGLQRALSLERCIVATTDSRKEVKEFGEENGVTVMDGHFLRRLIKEKGITGKRIVEEEFIKMIDHDSLGKLGGDWKGRFLVAKGRLLNKLDFDGANEWLSDIKYFLEQSIANPGDNRGALRLIYVLISYFLVAVDFIARGLVFGEQDVKYKMLLEGFRYGVKGNVRSKEILAVITNLLGTENSNLATRFGVEISKQANEIPVEVLAEYFSKPNNMKHLVQTAKEFEEKAYATEFVLPSGLDTKLQGIIGLLCDFHSVDRTKILSQ